MTISLTSPAFENGKFIPVKYTQKGDAVSPPLEWNGVPEGTRSFVLAFDDTDAPQGTRAHWLLFDIAAETRALPEHIPRRPTLGDGPETGIEMKQGENDFGKIGYAGPVVDRERPHFYFFTLYALDCTLHVAPGSNKDRLLAAMHGHILDQGELGVRFSE